MDESEKSRWPTLSLPEYFTLLIERTNTAVTSQERKDWLIDSLQSLRETSEHDVEEWRRNRPTSLTLWHGCLSELVDAGIFAQVEGDKKLKRKLRIFLGV